MVNKRAGIVLLVLGAILFAFSFPSIQKSADLTLPEQVPATYLMIGGAVFLVVGLILMRGKGSAREGPEVPIYQGKNIVGYRRH